MNSEKEPFRFGDDYFLLSDVRVFFSYSISEAVSEL